MDIDQMYENFNRYIEILSSVERDGIEDLCTYIKGTDFPTAPASTIYHMAEPGGLCKHSLNVYDNMVKLRDIYFPDMPDDTIKVAALCHDLAKIDFYKTEVRNKKVYSKDGSKSDELGNFDWVSVPGYRVKDASERDLICGEHGVNSYIITSRFIKLSEGEACAIINHHAGKDNGYALKDLNEAFNRFPTLTLLHLSDMLSTYCLENPNYTPPEEKTEEKTEDE